MSKNTKSLYFPIGGLFQCFNVWKLDAKNFLTVYEVQHETYLMYIP